LKVKNSGEHLSLPSAPFEGEDLTCSNSGSETRDMVDGVGRRVEGVGEKGREKVSEKVVVEGEKEGRERPPRQKEEGGGGGVGWNSSLSRIPNEPSLQLPSTQKEEKGAPQKASGDPFQEPEL